MKSLLVREGGEHLNWRRLHEVPVIIRDFSDETSLEVALVENLQRTDLNLWRKQRAIRC